MRVVDPVDNSEWMNADVLAAATIEPASGATPSYTALSATIMDAKAVTHFTPPPPTTAGAPASLLAEVYVKFYGTTLGGDYVESGEYLFPVHVCNGCLVSFPPDASVKYCSGAIPSTSTVEACEPGQDQYVDCQQCYAFSSACHG